MTCSCMDTMQLTLSSFAFEWHSAVKLHMKISVCNVSVELCSNNHACYATGNHNRCSIKAMLFARLSSLMLPFISNPQLPRVHKYHIQIMRNKVSVNVVSYCLSLTADQCSILLNTQVAEMQPWIPKLIARIFRRGVMWMFEVYV